MSEVPLYHDINPQAQGSKKTLGNTIAAIIPRKSHRGEYSWKTRWRGTPIRFATKITIQVLWDVTGSDTSVVIFVGKKYLSETLAAMKSVCPSRWTETNVFIN